MSRPYEPLLHRLREALLAAAQPERAPKMQTYMKSQMPYYGVPSVPLRAVCKAVFAGFPLLDAHGWREAVLGVWREAQFREERYAAIALAGDRRARAFQTMDSLALYEELITTGAWWDYVDVLASHRLGELLRNEPAAMKATMRQWSTDADLWKRRSAILCQLGFKKSTDLQLLTDCMAPSLASKEFFLRKAIGWALRQVAWVDADWVERYVAEHAAQLSPLSRREALKNL